MRPKYSNDGGSFLLIRDEHLLITGGNIVAAALIHIFEHWHYHKVANGHQNKEANETAERHGDQRTMPESLYQWHTTESLESQLKGLGSKRTIQEARQLLEDLGVITEHRNPNPRYTFDRTIHFLFYPNVVAELLLLKDQVSAPSAQMSQREDQSGQYPYISSINNPIDDSTDSAAAGATVDKKPDIKPDKKKKAPGAGTDQDWQRWVDAWHEFFKGRHEGIEPMWNGANLASLKKLRAYLCKIATQVDGKSRDDCGFGAWSFILENWDLLDEWQRGQFDLGVVYQKISNILTQIKNGTNTNRGAHASGNGKVSPGAARFEAIKNY